jgi:hypothetical protein
MTDQLTAALSPSPIRTCARLRTPVAACTPISSVTQRQRMPLGRFTAELRSHVCLRSNRWSGGQLSRSGCRMHSTAFDQPKANSMLLGFICSVPFVPSVPVVVSTVLSLSYLVMHPPVFSGTVDRNIRVRSGQRQDPVGVHYQLRHHRSADHVHRGWEEVPRGAIRLGRRCARYDERREALLSRRSAERAPGGAIWVFALNE